MDPCKEEDPSEKTNHLREETEDRNEELRLTKFCYYTIIFHNFNFSITV